MSAKIINGTLIAKQLKAEVSKEVKLLASAPGLAVILAGSNPASKVYVKFKHRACNETGIISHDYSLPDDAGEKELISLIHRLNDKPDIHGILVQLPLPPHLDARTVIDNISPVKDVDGFHPLNMGRLSLNLPGLRPCTPEGVITLLERSGIEIMGKNAVVIGSSNIVGRPMMLELLAKRATVAICHSKTRDLGLYTKEADILVVAVGIPEFIKAPQVKQGAVVIDVGINRLEDGTLAGDVDFVPVSKVASHITPVPGGVGPMTIATLMANTLKSYKIQ